jgi:hypothetical protein
VAWSCLVYLSAPAAKTLRIVGVGDKNVWRSGKEVTLIGEESRRE